jgi:hypothetical protein
MKLFGDIYVSFGFTALIITDRKLSLLRSAVCSKKLTLKETDVQKISFHFKP